MKFGKEFRTHLEETLPEWRDKFLCYKLLKKLLKHVPSDPFAAADDDAPSTVDGILPPVPSLADLHDWFVKILSEEFEKFNNFYVDKEEEFVIRLQELKERIERVKEKSSKDGVITSEAEFSEEMMDIRKDFVTIHGEMVLLKNYSSLNFAGTTVFFHYVFLLYLIWLVKGGFVTIHRETLLLKNYSSLKVTGLVKILKKYDKRTGELLQLHFTQLALHQPFFTTEPLTRLVRGCEVNLELLFPLEAEVVQSATTEQDGRSLTPSEVTNIFTEPSLSLGECQETTDIYRSTLAAMRTIKGLKRESSTHNPLSFASLFGRQDDENAGSVTAENSPRDSLGTLPPG